MSGLTILCIIIGLIVGAFIAGVGFSIMGINTKLGEIVKELERIRRQ